MRSYRSAIVAPSLHRAPAVFDELVKRIFVIGRIVDVEGQLSLYDENELIFLFLNLHGCVNLAGVPDGQLQFLRRRKAA